MLTLDAPGEITHCCDYLQSKLAHATPASIYDVVFYLSM